MNEIVFLLKLQQNGVKFLTNVQYLGEDMCSRVRDLVEIAKLPDNFIQFDSRYLHKNLRYNPQTYYNQDLHEEFMNFCTYSYKSTNKITNKQVVSFLNKCPNPQQSVYLSLLTQEFKLGVSKPSLVKAFGELCSIEFYPIYTINHKPKSVIGKFIAQPMTKGTRVMVMKVDDTVIMITSSNKRIFCNEITDDLLKISGDFVMKGAISDCKLYVEDYALAFIDKTPFNERALKLQSIFTSNNFKNLVLHTMGVFADFADWCDTLPEGAVKKYIYHRYDSVFMEAPFSLEDYTLAETKVELIKDNNKLLLEGGSTVRLLNKKDIGLTWLEGVICRLWVNTQTHNAIFVEAIDSKV